MDKLARLGQALFALAMTAFGVQHLLVARGGAWLGPPWVLHRGFWVYLAGIVLLIGGVVLLLRRKSRVAASLLTSLLFFYPLLVYAPKIVRSPHDPGPWTSGAELIGLCAAALVLAGAAFLGRSFFAVFLGILAVQHFLYAGFIQSLIPAWIPGHLFWAYFAGVAFLAVALAIVTRRIPGIACALLGTMFFLWVIVLHAPRLMASPRNGAEVTSLVMALGMSGASWIMAGRSE